jgi:tetratricopeptide (TPR) repeat protein
MGLIFISHVEEDALVADALCDALDAEGYESWNYRRHGKPGLSYLLQTGSAIDASAAVFLLISESSLGSHQITKEVVRAHEANKPIFPLLIGVSHEHFQRRQPEWREALGAATSLSVDRDRVFASVPRLLQGLRALGIFSGCQAAAPRPTPRIETADGEAERRIPFQAQRLPDPFVGRDDEARAVGQLFDGHDIVIIRGGLGGLGKSALASKVADDLRTSFPDGVFWLRIDEADAESQILTLLASLDERLPDRVSELGVRAKANLLWSQLSTRRALVVLDNVETAEEVKYLIPPKTPCRFLLTTRNALDLAGARELPLRVLGDAPAGDLLARLAGLTAPADDPTVLRIVGLLGGLPLAIQMAGRTMRDLQMTAEQYLAAIEGDNPLAWLDAPDGAAGVRSCFALSYDRLPEGARESFRAFGTADRHAVPGDAMICALGRPAPATLRDLALLVRRGLIEVGKNDRTFRIHPLMADYARQLLAPAEARVFHLRLAEWGLACIGLWDADARRFRHGGDASAADVESAASAYHHFASAGEFARAHDVLVGMADPMTRTGRHRFLFDGIETLARHVPLDPWLRLYRCDFVLNASYEGDEQVARAELVELSRRDEAAPADPKLASAALICLAKYSYANHRIDEAEGLFLRSQELKLRADPPDLKGVAYILNELARVRLTRGQPAAEALDLHRQALALQEQLGDTKGVAYTRRRIATLLLRRLNDVKGALSTLRLAEAAAERCGLTFVLIDVLLEKAEAQHRGKHFAQAVETVERALTLARDTNDARAEMHALKRAYAVFEAVEFYGRARDAVERALQLREGTSFFEPYDAAELEPARTRLTRKIDALRAELGAVESGIRDLEGRQHAARAAPASPQEGKEIRRLLRIARKRRKRIRQRLGEEAAQIRIGKRLPRKGGEGGS